MQSNVISKNVFFKFWKFMPWYTISATALYSRQVGGRCGWVSGHVVRQAPTGKQIKMALENFEFSTGYKLSSIDLTQVDRLLL